MFVVITRNFPPEIGGIQSLMEGLSEGLRNHGPVKIFADEYPDCKDIANEQKLYIKNYVNSFEDALFSDNYSDTNNGYQEYMNVHAALDYFIVNETANNIDAYRLSTFMHKDKEAMGGSLILVLFGILILHLEMQITD